MYEQEFGKSMLRMHPDAVLQELAGFFRGFDGGGEHNFLQGEMTIDVFAMEETNEAYHVTTYGDSDSILRVH